MRAVVFVLLIGSLACPLACSSEPEATPNDAVAPDDDTPVGDDDDDDDRKDAGKSDGSSGDRDAPEGRDADTDVEAPTTEVHPDGTARLRVVAANITSGNLQKYEQPGIRILQSLQPDVALLQEVNYGNDTAADVRTFVDQAFGASFSIFRGEGRIPNAVVSRYPILESGDWNDAKVQDRTFVWARIDIPGPVDLLAVSVHLLSSQASARNDEAKTLLEYVAQKAAPGTYVTIGGDFNTSARGESCMATFGAVFGTSAPFPVDTAGKDNTNGPRSKPYDWVIANAALDGIKTSVKIVSKSLPSGLVFDTREFKPLTEVPPSTTNDSAAPSMQHMAVVRDFMLPGIAP